MSRAAFLAAALAALFLPVAALAALIFQQERGISTATVINVPVRGVDPRDLLRGRYLRVEFDWDWQDAPTSARAGPVEGELCVLTAPDPAVGGKPRVAFAAKAQGATREAQRCKAILVGRGWAERGQRVARFTPASLDTGLGSFQLFVPEDRARELEKLVVQRPGALSVDLAIRRDGHASIRGIRIDGKPLGR